MSSLDALNGLPLDDQIDALVAETGCSRAAAESSIRVSDAFTDAGKRPASIVDGVFHSSPLLSIRE